MKMNETVHNCLTAVLSREDRYIIEVNEEVWKHQSAEFNGKTIREIVERLPTLAPALLKAPARVELEEAQKCEIYLLDLSSETPAIRLYLRRGISPENSISCKARNKDSKNSLPTLLGEPNETVQEPR